MKVGHLVISTQGIVVAANETAAAIMQFATSDLIGAEWSIPFFGPTCENSPSLANAIGKIVGGGQGDSTGYSTIAPVDAPATSVRWCVSRVLGLDASTSVVVSLFVDEEAAEGAIRNQARHGYRETFEHAVEGIFRTTPEGRYLEVNPSLARMYGFATPAALIEALPDLNTQLYVDARRRAEFVERMLEDGLVRDFESEVFRADGSKMWIAEYARAVFDESHHPVFYEGSVVDITEHRAAEAKLRESEEKFRLLVETMNLLPWEAEVETRRYTYVGPQAYEFLGFPVEDWREEGFWNRQIHPEDREWVEVVQAEAMAKGDSFESEYRMVRADGRVIWVRDMMRIIPAVTGEFIGGFMLDVSYRRMTEASLQKSQYFFERVIDASAVILYLYDFQAQRCFYVSGRVEEILGYSAETLREMNPFFINALGHPDEAEDQAVHMEKIKQGKQGEIVEREFRLRGAGGKWVWLRSRETLFEPADAEGAPRIVGTAVDITVRRMAFEELVSNETLFRNLAENTRAIPFEYDPQAARFSYIGPQEALLLGYPRSSWYHTGFWESIVHQDDLEAAMRFTSTEREGRQTGVDMQSEFRLRKANGEYLWLAQVVRCANPEENRSQARGFLFDITETKEREEEIARSRELMRQLTFRVHTVREEERKNIAREIHDELGQALTLLRIELEWLEVRFAKLSVQDSAIETKLREMKVVTGATLETVRRISTSLRPPVLDEFGLLAAIEWQIGEFSRRVGMRCDLQKEAFECEDQMVATAVFRIFQEILTNIARHSKASSVKAKLRETMGSVFLSVSDNGQGFVVSPDGKHKSFGLLGMRERAENLGGKLTISSTTGVGTTVTLLLPLHRDTDEYNDPFAGATGLKKGFYG